MHAHIFHLHALSALHVGVGQAIGVVDLPIMRARASNLPIVPGSAIKGVLRDEFAGHDKQKTLFGPDEIKGDQTTHAGTLAFGDAQLLILPVRALAGVTAFVTCPFILNLYRRDLMRVGVTNLPDLPSPKTEGGIMTQNGVNRMQGNKVVLEDLDIAVEPGADDWAKLIASRLHPKDEAWQKLFIERFLVVADDLFSFLADTATEIRARIRIDDSKGTVERGALWYEENLPAETVLWGMLACSPARDGSKDSAETLARVFTGHLGLERVIQIGGKATVGRGLVRFLV